MERSFTCYGHRNITLNHKTTLEFTKDSEVSLKGDCIAGVKADFSLGSLKKFIKSLSSNKKITIVIETINNGHNKMDNNRTIEIAEKNKIIEKISAEINPDFNSDKEIVIRKSDFRDSRTFAIKAGKGAIEINRDLADALKGKKVRIRVFIKACA